MKISIKTICIKKKKNQISLILACKKIIQWIDELTTNCIRHKFNIIEQYLMCKLFNKREILSTTSTFSKLKILNHI